MKNITKNNSELMKRLLPICIFLACVFLLVLVIGLIKNRSISYSSLESKILSATKSYYSKNEDELPKIMGDESELKYDFLVEKGYLKEITKYIKNDNCSAKAYVTKTYDDYFYSVDLSCDKYETNGLSKYILENENIVDTADGLYSAINGYIYRGDYVNNYVSYGGYLWRIIKIDSEGNIRLIRVAGYDSHEWDDRYNIDTDDYGINTFDLSRMKKYLFTIYNDKEFLSPKAKEVIVPKQLCIGRRSKESFDNTGTIECGEKTEDYYPIGLISLYEYYNATLDNNCDSIRSESCSNYNYLNSFSTWTVTASDDNTDTVYYLSSRPGLKKADDYAMVSPVIVLNGKVTYSSGDGTKKNPYMFKEDDVVK